MTRNPGKHGSSAAFYGVIAFVVGLAAVEACLQANSDKEAVPVGHFISASISWVKDEASADENAVIFEIISTWRRNHTWPCNRRLPYTGPDARPGLGDIVPIVGISESSVNTRTNVLVPIQDQPGTISARLETGDHGKGYDMKLQVTSYSIEEDWMTGVSYIRHVYSEPYADKKPTFGTKYVASVATRDFAQPYDTVPWTASISGCCRRFPGADGKYTFSIHAKVDLSDNIGSPRIVSLPQLWLHANRGNNRIYMCALAVAGKRSMVSKTGGTLNNVADDNMPIEFDWAVMGGSEGARFEDRAPGVSSNCRKLLVPKMYTISGQMPVYDNIKVVARLGRAEVAADLPIHILPNIPAPSMAVPQYQSPPFTCLETDDCQMVVSLGQPLSNSIARAGTPKTGNLSFYHGGGSFENPLEVRYVVGKGSMQTGLLASSQSRVRYSKTSAGLDHAGLPRGASLNPVSRIVTGCNADVATCPGDTETSCKYVTEVSVSFGSTMNNARPLHDVAYSAESRDYAALVGNMEVQANALKAQGYVAVDNSNFNNASGGAVTGIWLQRDPVMPAVTDLILVNSSGVAKALEDGYTKLDRNLLEQSGRGEVFIMYKKGSGSPLLDVRTSPPTHCSHCYACDPFVNQTTKMVMGTAGYERMRAEAWSGDQMTAVVLWIKRGPDRSVRRRLEWTPCTGDDEDWVVCAQGSQVAPLMMSSTPMRCVLIQVQPKPPPRFLDCSTRGCAGDVDVPVNGVYRAYMGVKLRIPVIVDQDSGKVGEVVSMHFTEDGKPPEVPFVDDVLTARTPKGIYITSSPNLGPEAGSSQLSPRGLGDNPSPTRVRGYIMWTPSPYQGGWHGQICVKACVSQSACPAVRGQTGDLCSEPKCFTVAVERCSWAVQHEDSLVTIAPRFQTNWLQLWYANPGISHPDFSLMASPNSMQLINVGRVYKAKWDDTVEKVSDRFGITVQRLKDLNADLAALKPTDTMAVEQDLCIIPDSCSVAPPSNSGKNH